MKISNKLTLPIAVAALAVTGASVIAFQTHAQTSDTQPQTNNEQHPPQNFDYKMGGHIGKNGIKEELLTGETADKVTEAAKKALPDGTIERVESDAEGDKYEAHMTKADGSRITLKFDENYNVTATEDGPKHR